MGKAEGRGGSEIPAVSQVTRLVPGMDMREIPRALTLTDFAIDGHLQPQAEVFLMVNGFGCKTDPKGFKERTVRRQKPDMPLAGPTDLVPHSFFIPFSLITWTGILHSSCVFLAQLSAPPPILGTDPPACGRGKNPAHILSLVPSCLKLGEAFKVLST